ncbi:unnamed protein product [Somion occarium]|uniref:Palmitoyltransferase n=1 Tax=Somion occarium TaxID=3059160 RepID=A0ABP1CU32_9APHY
MDRPQNDHWDDAGDNTGDLGGRRIGIPFLVIFCLLGLTMLWAYAKVTLTSPGKARDHVDPSPEPVIQNYVPAWFDSESEIGHGPYVPPTQEQHGNGSASQPKSHSAQARVTNGSEKPVQQEDTNVGVMGTLPPVQNARVHAEQNGSAYSNPTGANTGTGPLPNQQPMMFTRKPPPTPALLPEYRYCYKDGFVKPTRAHHCRACGTCILKYDHHCPWIGQCVGARNHKFFVNFLQWACLFCLWTFSTLVAQNVKASQGPNENIDPQEVVVTALSGLFSVFTLALLATQMRLIIMNYTTVESMGFQRTEEREKTVLARLHEWYEFGAKRRTKKQWDKEWGRISKEGNMWWLGSYRRNWEYVMGHSVWEWFLPIGRSEGDGVNFPLNPRFDKDGRWRPRREWPKELQ